MTERDLAYIAGIIDGEGCVTFQNSQSNSHICPLVTVTNSSKELIEWLRNTTNCGRTCEYRRANCRIYYTISWSGGKAIYVLRQTFDDLIVKKLQAQLILNQFDYEEERRELKKLYDYYANSEGIFKWRLSKEVMLRREIYKDKIQELNKKGINWQRRKLLEEENQQ